jgi:hypothetical protein
MFVDDAAAPIVGAGVAQGAEHAAERGGLVGARCELQLDRIDFNGVRMGQVATAIDETSHGRTGPVGLHDKATGGDRLNGPWQGDMDKGLWHRP